MYDDVSVDITSGVRDGTACNCDVTTAILRVTDTDIDRRRKTEKDIDR